MRELEQFINDVPERTPSLLKAALAHVQFETIHPFLDGNGRLGRLLITLMLCADNVLSDPLLYLSLYFKQNRDEYYDALSRVRSDGDWAGWIRFFMDGVYETANGAVDTARRITSLFDGDAERISRLGRRSRSMLQVHNLLREHPIISVPTAASSLGLTAPTVRSALKHLETCGIAREVTGKKRDRSYIYDAYVSILAEGTEPLED